MAASSLSIRHAARDVGVDLEWIEGGVQVGRAGTALSYEQMLGRLIPLVLAMVLAITPMARAICEWSCADGIHGASSTASAHHAHSPPTPDHTVADSQPQHSADSHPIAAHDHPRRDGRVSASDGSCCQVAISVVPLCCTHADSHAVSIAAAKIALEPPAITPAAFDLSDLLAFSVSTARVSPVARPPVPLSLRTPLRV